MTAESIAKELARIMATIPPAMKEGVVTEEKLTPTIEFVMDEALKMDSIRPELKEQIQHLKDAGEFNKTVIRENPTRARIIDEYVAREIRKSVRAGRLPKKKDLMKLPEIKEMFDKVKNS